VVFWVLGFSEFWRKVFFRVQNFLGYWGLLAQGLKQQAVRAAEDHNLFP